MRVTAVRTAILIALVVVAFGALAATLDSTETPQGRCDPGANASASQVGTTPTTCGPPSSRLRVGGNVSRPSGGGPSFSCPGPLSNPAGLAGLLAVVGVVAGAIGRLRGNLLVPAVVFVPIALGAAGTCTPGLLGAAFWGVVRLGGLASGSLALLGWFVVGLVGAVGLLYVVSGDPRFFGGEGTVAEDEVDLGAVGEAAGAAADRIANDADVDNEVFRAWREMVRHLDVSNPEATAPDEFERAAIEAGMREADVSTITRLFEDVRYGGRDPERRAERAIEALRRIEAEYAPDENGRVNE